MAKKKKSRSVVEVLWV